MSSRSEAPDEGADRGSARPEPLHNWAASVRALDIEVATRAGLAVAIPLIVLASIGRLDLALYSSFGAFTSLYGRSEVYRTRLRTAASAALMLIACIVAGVLVSDTGGGLIALVGGLLLVLIVGVVLARTLSLHPPTPIFFAFAFLVCGIVPVPSSNSALAILIGVASAVLALAITMSGWLLRRGRVFGASRLLKPLPRRAVLRPNAWRDGGVWLNIAQLVVGALIAGGAASAMGLGHSYWAVVSVVAVVPPVRATHSVSRSIHRTLGTLAGVVVTGLVLWAHPEVWVIILIVTICQFGAEIFVGRHYGTALVFITPLALLMVHLSSPSAHVPDLLIDRAIETALGAVVGMLMVLLARLVPINDDEAPRAAR